MAAARKISLAFVKKTCKRLEVYQVGFTLFTGQEGP
jgi:hypothetical protein